MKKLLLLLLLLAVWLLTCTACTSAEDTDLPPATANPDTEPVEISTRTPLHIMQELYPDNPLLYSAPGCREVVLSDLTEEEKDGLVRVFTEEDFTPIDTVRVPGAKMETSVLRRGEETVTMYWLSSVGELRVLWEKPDEGSTVILTPDPDAVKGEIRAAQIGIERDKEKDNPLIGMCYVIRLADGSAIIIDGGFGSEKCADNLFRSLAAMDIAKDDAGRYRIAAWIFTHAHADHIEILRSFSPKYAGQVCVSYFLHAFPGDSTVAGGKASYNGSFESLFAKYYPDAVRVNPHAGLNYYFGNAVLSMLYTPDLLYENGKPVAWFNDTSLVFRLEANGQSILFFGDAGNAASYTMLRRYEKSAFKSDILQITHHGLTTSADGHDWMYLVQIYRAAGAPYAFLPMHSYYEPEGRNGRYTVLIGWGSTGHQASFVVNENDHHGLGKSGITEQYFTDFIQQVEAGGAGQPTLFGYDGINKIVNENGMITYLGSTNDAPTATVFTLGEDGVTVTENALLQEFLSVGKE